jgi:hypothetical protein
MLYHIYKIDAEKRDILGRMLGTLWDAESSLDSTVEPQVLESGQSVSIPLSVLLAPDSVDAHLKVMFGGGTENKKDKTMAQMSKEEFLAVFRGTTMGAFKKPTQKATPPPSRPIDDPLDDPEVKRANSAGALTPEQFKALLAGKLPG